MQVKPDNQYSAGISFAYSNPGGMKTEATIGVLVSSDECENRVNVPPATEMRLRISMREPGATSALASVGRRCQMSMGATTPP